MKWGTAKRILVFLLSFTMVFQTLTIVPSPENTASADYAVADSDTIIGTFYNYDDRVVSNHSSLGLYCDWTTIDGGKAIDMTANGIDEGAYLHLTITLDAIKDGQHVSDFTLGGFYLKLRSLDNNGENNAGWYNITLKEGVNQLDIPLYSDAGSYAGTAYPYTSKTGTMDWSCLNRLIVVSLDARDYYGTDTEVSMTLSDVCITCPTDKRDDSAFENVRIAEPTLASEDKIVYSVDAVADMGADNTGSSDSTAAIQSAIDSVSGAGGVVFLPAGQYRVDGTLNVPGGVTLRGEWMNPDEGGLGKGTILKAYYGAGDVSATPFITMASGSCLRDISVWYPEQSATSPVAYPYTIKGSGHTSVYNVTLYNSYNGFYNNSCSSMLIRGMYGTVLNTGIWGAYAYDVPRTEKVSFDTAYWANSGLSGAPSGSSLDALNTYCENNTIGILGGEQDWGYWYDIYVNHAKYACYLTAVMDDNGAKVHPGNDAIGNLRTENVQYGIYIHSTSYPGLEVSYCDIDADVAGICYAPKPANTDYIGNEDGTVNAAYYNNASIVITKSDFSGSGYAYQGINDAGTYSAVNFNDCVFESWSDAAIYMAEGNLVCSNGVFSQSGTAINLESNVVQAVLSGNTFASDNAVVYDSATTAMDMTEEQLVPNTPDYDYGFAPSYNPATNNVFNVEAYGAVAGVVDSTAAFQAALDAAKAAGGGTVYVPAGYYTLKGSLTVYEGVELRGTFDGAHYGNSTTNGSVLYVYANKDNPSAEAFITLEQNAGVRGFTIVYPEQGITDDASLDEVVHEYPATVEMNKGSWVRTCSINATYTMIDAMTNVCDGFVLNDVTGCYMGYGLLLGHGTNGGYVQDFHSNYTSWPTSYLHAYEGNVEKTVYTTQNSTWMVLGDFSNVEFFSNFTILISTGMQLIADPYTGECTQDMLAWGTAFDATGNGIIGEAGADTTLTLLSSMGVYNQHDVSYNIITREGFTGTINMYNADVWSPSSRLVNASGGTINLVQYLSWCCYLGVCHEGGTVNLYGSTFVGSGSGSNLAMTYEQGSKGTVAGNNNNYGNFNVTIEPGATDVVVENNGLTIDRSSDIAVEFNTYAPGTYSDADGVVTTGWKALTPIQLSSGSTQNHASLSGYNPEDLYMKVVLTIDKGSNTADDSDIFKNGTISLRQAWSAGDGSDDALCYTLNDGYFYVKSGEEVTLYMPMADAVADNSSFNWSGVKFVNITLDVTGYTGISMTVSDVRIVDSSVANYWKYVLYQTIEAGPDVDKLDKDTYGDYISLVDEAMELYWDDSASMEELQAMITAVETAQEGVSIYLDRTGWSASASHNNDGVNYALDNDIDTRWTTLAVQEPGQWFIVDLGKATAFDTVVMLLGTSTSDMPAAYEIYVSLDGENWGDPVRTGTEAIEEYYVGTQYARYVKIEQTGSKYLYWSIHEFNLMNTNSGEPDVDSSISEDNLLLHGRTYYENEELKLTWTNSGVTFNINGTGATAVISTTNTAELLKGYINVYVDDALVPTNTICITESGATYVLAEGLTNGAHTITLRKRNEAAYGGNATLGISKITVTGGSFTEPPVASDRRIEIIGDSITSGFGNMVEDGEGNYSSSNTEGTMTYAALTGKAFGADTSIVSRSGIRFVRTTTGESMIDYYLQTSGLVGNTTPWDFDGGNDVVVINLGTNDNGATDSDGNSVTDEYVQSEAVELLKMVRSVNPDAIIIWAYGMMGSGRSSAIQAAVESMNDDNMYFLALDVIDKTTEGSGVGSHPTITADVNRSFDLVEFIAEKTGWDYDYDVQLATQVWVYEQYSDEMLSEYTTESVNNFKAAITHANELSSDSSSTVTKAEVEALQAARNALETKLEAAPELDRTGWTATASVYSNNAGLALDDDISTRWATIGLQTAGQWFMVDLGQPQTFDIVELLLGTSTNDGPAGYEIYVSLDGVNWGEPVLSGSDNLEQYYVGTQYAQYVKIVQTGEKSNYWSIHEFNLKNSEAKEYINITYYDGNTLIQSDSFEKGAAISLADAPEADGKIFAGWYIEAVTLDSADAVSGAVSKAADVSQISDDTTLYAGWIEIGSGDKSFSLLGTQVRITDPSGLRFITQIGTELIAEIEALNSANASLQPESATDKGIGFGTVTTVTTNIGSGELVKDINATKVKSGMVVSPAVKNFNITDDYIQYTCVVKGIGTSNYETEIAARPYITYKDANGVERTYYYTEADSSAGGGYSVSLYKAAKAVYALDSTSDTIKSWLSENIINIVEK